MTEDDADRFTRLLGTIEAAYRVRFSRETIAVYWQGLRALTWLEVRHAIERAIETCTRVPTIAELRALTSTGRVDPSRQHRGTYPPDIARRRKELGLPVTAEEHAEYDRGLYEAPPVTKSQMVATLREIATRPLTQVCEALQEKMRRDGGARLQWMRDLANDIERRHPTARRYGLFGDVLAGAVKRRQDREPGEEG
jgi:hypothetical protein